jgi:hypothetical protein
MRTIKHRVVTSAPSLFRLTALTSALLATAPASAFQFQSGDLSGSFDTTVTAGLAWRVQDRDPDLIGRANGGTRNSVNNDNGDLNYDTGLYSSLIKVTHDLELNYGIFGAFFRGYYFYDFENEDGDRERLPLSDDALDRVGSDVRLLDAYVSGSFELGDKPLNLRIGNQVVSWGESTFIPNGINTINPVDVSALRSPGAELREAFVPVNMVWGSLGLSNNVSVEAFYQLDWESVIIDPAGTYFSTNDFASDGGDTVYLGFGAVPDTITNPLTGELMPMPAGLGLNSPVGVAVPRSADRLPNNDGQYGLALRMFVPELNDTELGFYYMNYHSRLPVISARTGTLTGLLSGDYAASASYFVEYPEDIKLLGASFNTSLGDSGISLQGEVSHRLDVPLQVDDVELLYAALSAIPGSTGAFLGATNQLGAYTFGQEISGYRSLDVTQAQLTATKAFGPTFGADQWVFVTEVGMTQVHDMPKRNELRFDGPGTYTSGNSIFTLAGVQPATESSAGFPDDFSMGYRMLARFDYSNVIGAINLSPRIAFAHDVVGTTPLPLGNFIQDRKALTLGLGATYLDTWSADISYTRYFDAEDYNLIHDRDFIALNIKWSK